MVLTPLHYPQAYFFYKLGEKKLSFPGLLIGSFLPDIEIPVLILLGCNYPYCRLVLHSFLGSLMFSWIIGLAVLPLYKFLLKSFLKYRREIKVDMLAYIVSVEISSLTHVFVDGMHHSYNPLLWPFTSESINVLIPFGNRFATHIILHIIFFALTAIIIFVELSRKRVVHGLNLESLRRSIVVLLTLDDN